MHFLKKLWCSWIDLFQQAVFPCFLSLTSSHACTYASLIKQQATVCSVGLLLSVWLPPLSYCSSVLLECSCPSCACCEDRSYSGASPASGVGGEWLANHTQDCLLPSAQPGDRETGTETWQREIAGCRGDVGVTHAGSGAWHQSVPQQWQLLHPQRPMALWEADCVWLSWLCWLLHHWMKPRLTLEVCSEFILLMHTAARCLSPASACSAGRSWLLQCAQTRGEQSMEGSSEAQREAVLQRKKLKGNG